MELGGGVKRDYLNAVCTRIITMLSPPTNEDVVTNLLAKTSPVIKREVCVVTERQLPWEVALASTFVGFVAMGIVVLCLKKMIIQNKEENGNVALEEIAETDDEEVE